MDDSVFKIFKPKLDVLVAHFTFASDSHLLNLTLLTQQLLVFVREAIEHTTSLKHHRVI
jgi:hypothetical protein